MHLQRDITYKYTLLWVELCLFQNSYVEVLKCD